MSLQGVVRTAGGALLAQASLHAELLGEAWQEEKGRLRGMLLALLLGFACLLCGLLVAGALPLAVFWDTPMRIPAVVVVLALYTLGATLALRSAQRHSRAKNEALAISREELAADVLLLRSQL